MHQEECAVPGIVQKEGNIEKTPVSLAPALTIGSAGASSGRLRPVGSRGRASRVAAGAPRHGARDTKVRR